jgi:Ser/Thr protein kinase RdoA (MazF antagonist)
MSTRDDLLQYIAVEPPNLDAGVVAEAVAEQFGLAGNYSLLVSERDQNFCLTTANSDRYLVKITSPAEPRDVTDFQIAALDHLANCGVIGVPQNVRTTAGKKHGLIQSDDGTPLCLRVLTWLNGSLLDDSETTPEMSNSLGGRLADLDVALESFIHESDGHASLWDTQRAGQLRGLLVHVDDTVMRQQLETVLDVMEERVTPVLETLPRQVIHNDANTENILLDTNGDVSGIIDFGDLLRATRIIEVSTAAAYLRPDGDDPLQLLVPFVAGYHEKSPLSAAELDVLFDLILIRLAITVILFYWRLAARDKEDPYLQKLLDSEGGAFEFLQSLSSLGQAAFRERITP